MKVINEKNCLIIAVLNWSWGHSLRYYKVSAGILFLPQVESKRKSYTPCTKHSAWLNYSVCNYQILQQ